MPKNNDFLIFCFFIVGVYSHKIKHTNRNKDSLKTTVKSLLFYNAIIKKLDNSDFFILVFLIKSICSYESKYINTKNKDNKQDKIYLYI